MNTNLSIGLFFFANASTNELRDNEANGKAIQTEGEH